MSRRAGQCGATAIEALLALPVLLAAGLGAIQLALAVHARHALTYALQEAARSGSVAHADPDVIREGLARGLVPWLDGASDHAGLARAVASATVHVRESEALGRLRLVLVSPTADSFADWAEPARGPDGRPLDGVREIPNDDLVHRATRTRPATGTAGQRGGEPIGAASGQTLADANLLKLRLDYGVPLAVPFVGRLLARAMRAWEGCGAMVPGAPGAPGGPGGPAGAAVPDPWRCATLGATDGAPRLPVTVWATVRMQSPAREAGAGGGAADARPGRAGRPSGPTESSFPDDTPGPSRPVVVADGPVRSAPPGQPSGSILASTGSAPDPSADPAFCRSPGP